MYTKVEWLSLKPAFSKAFIETMLSFLISAIRGFLCPFSLINFFVPNLITSEPKPLHKNSGFNITLMFIASPLFSNLIDPSQIFNEVCIDLKILLAILTAFSASTFVGSPNGRIPSSAGCLPLYILSIKTISSSESLSFILWFHPIIINLSMLCIFSNSHPSLNNLAFIDFSIDC